MPATAVACRVKMKVLYRRVAEYTYLYLDWKKNSRVEKSASWIIGPELASQQTAFKIWRVKWLNTGKKTINRRAGPGFAKTTVSFQEISTWLTKYCCIHTILGQAVFSNTVGGLDRRSKNIYLVMIVSNKKKGHISCKMLFVRSRPGKCLHSWCWLQPILREGADSHRLPELKRQHCIPSTVKDTQMNT